MATYAPATPEEVALVLQSISTEGDVPTGFAYNSTWPDKVRRVVPGPSPHPVWSPEGLYLDSRVDELEERAPQTIVTDAVGEWWIHPVATYQDRPYPRTAFGAIASDGAVLACEFNHGTGRTRRYEIAQAIVDDHCVPALWVEDGHRPVAFWTRHNADWLIRVKAGARSGDLGSLVGAPERSTNIQGTASYTQVHRIAHLSDETQDTFWVFMRRNGTLWLIQPVTVRQEDGAITFGSRTGIVDAGTEQTYVTTADAHNAGGDQTIRCAWGFNPNADRHEVFYIEINCVTGDITSPVDSAFSANLNGTGLYITPEDLDPIVPEVEAGNNRRLFYVRPGPDAPAVAYADWTVGSEEESTYRLHELADGYLIPNGGSAQTEIDTSLDPANGFTITVALRTPTSPTDQVEVARRFASGSRGWSVRLNTNKTLALRMDAVVLAHNITGPTEEAIPFEWGDDLGVRMVADLENDRLDGYYSLNPLSDNPDWVLLGGFDMDAEAVPLYEPAPLSVPTSHPPFASATRVYYAEYRDGSGTLLAGVDWRREWAPSAATYTDAAGIVWSLNGEAAVTGYTGSSTLGVSGPSIYPASNYIAGLAFENPSHGRVVVRARSEGGREYLEKLRPDGAGDFDAESIAEQASIDGRLVRPIAPVNGGPFAALVTSMTSYAGYQVYEGNVRGA